MCNFIILLGLVLTIELFSASSNTEKGVIDANNKLIKIPLTKIKSNYYGYIIVGTANNIDGNQHIFRVNFDTGSQHLWLMSTEVCKTPDCKNEKFTPYDKSKSSTYENIMKQNQFRLTYTDGTVVTGDLARDVVQLGIEGASLSIKQTIGLAKSVKGNVEDCDGIFGLGLLSTSLFPGNPDPPIWTLNKNFGIQEFSIYFARVLKGEGAGMLIFGGHDESYFNGDLQWHNVIKKDGLFQGYKIQFDKIILQKGDSTKDYIPNTAMLALPDTGNNVITLPTTLFDEIKDDILGYVNFRYTATYSFLCKENISVLPNVIFVMDGREYTMYPEDYIWILPSGKLCKLGIIGRNSEHIVLGQIFLKTFYSKYNIIRQAVGFARAKHPL